ncbi:E3 ubiquitin-protein ligase DTX4-like [Tubulanus polymorphus]|uniref:E3 ubiquitin-protein ligase DTX4-like n=1 Tax=Tubulanus polymorphus TaxID=672921 RepID=UPI003DA45419
MESSIKSVVVWEWFSGYWKPYTPVVSCFIESRRDTETEIHLAQADPSMNRFIIDVEKLLQITSDDAGKTVKHQIPIRRKIYSADTPPGSGVEWKWSGDSGSWYLYDIETACVLENAFNRNISNVDLTIENPSLPYKIDLKSMTQTRIGTGFIRHVQRVPLTSVYTPICMPNATKSAAAVASSNRVTRSKSAAAAAVSSTSSGRKSGLKPSISLMAVKHAHGSSTESSSSSIGSIDHTDDGHSPKKVRKPSKKKYKCSTNSSSPSKSVPAVVNTRSRLLKGSKSVDSGLATNNAHSSATANLARSTTNYTLSGRTNQGSLISPAMTGVTNMLLLPLVPFLLSSNKSLNSPIPQHIPSQPLKATKPKKKKKALKWHSVEQQKPVDRSFDAIVKKYSTFLTAEIPDEDCCICCDRLHSSGGFSADHEEEAICKLNRCDHIFHRSCVSAMYNSGTKDGSLQCPTCKMIYGEKFGNCPPGRMEYGTFSASLPSFDCETIRIIYTIPPGIQGSDHPHPGKPFSARAFPRYCYLPNNENGRKALQLLEIAWRRRLTFTIGTSATTGEQNTVTWNEIHHKTEFGSNESGHGFPDTNYFDNLFAELAAQGVTCD